MHVARAAAADETKASVDAAHAAAEEAGAARLREAKAEWEAASAAGAADAEEERHRVAAEHTARVANLVSAASAERDAALRAAAAEAAAALQTSNDFASEELGAALAKASEEAAAQVAAATAAAEALAAAEQQMALEASLAASEAEMADALREVREDKAAALEAAAAATAEAFDIAQVRADEATCEDRARVAALTTLVDGLEQENAALRMTASRMQGMILKHGKHAPSAAGVGAALVPPSPPRGTAAEVAAETIEAIGTAARAVREATGGAPTMAGAHTHSRVGYEPAAAQSDAGGARAASPVMRAADEEVARAKQAESRFLARVGTTPRESEEPLDFSEAIMSDAQEEQSSPHLIHRGADDLD